MPRPIPRPHLRQTVRRATGRSGGRSISFQRPDLPERPPSSPSTLSPSRSFPNLSKLVEKSFGNDPCADELTHPNLPSHTIASSTSTITDVSQHQSQPPPPPPPPSPSRPLLRRIGSSRSLRRLSLGHRRTSSFAEPTSEASSTAFSTGFSGRLATESVLSGWVGYRKKRCASYSCTDFEFREESLVEIGRRLPDRTDGVREDVFGRRRGTVQEVEKKGVLAYEVEETEEEEDEEETLRNIALAIDSSKGRLRKSANMSKAFRAVIKSGEGLVRKSELIRATLNSEESKDPSMIILLDPDSCDSGNTQMEGVSSTSEESGSVETVKSSGAPSASMSFNTSMSAKQCSATLETMLREMKCKVCRLADEGGQRTIIRLKVIRTPAGGRRMDRKIRVLVTIREEDHIRTSVSFKRISGLYSSKDSHIPLCTDIRDRFQREWPPVVEALYIRIPNMQKRQVEL